MNQTRTALVTGGARRVGRAIVQELIEQNWNVIFTYRSSQDEALELSKSTGARPIQLDLSDPHRAEQFAVDLSKEIDRLDLLVNNASIFEKGIDADHRMAIVNCGVPTMLAVKFEPLLARQNGLVIHMLDILAERIVNSYIGYCASKAKLWTAMKLQAVAFAPHVRVNGIAPGVVDWPDDYPETERTRYLKKVPLARAGTPQDVAHLVKFLATEGTYITGQAIRLDGGKSLVS